MTDKQFLQLISKSDIFKQLSQKAQAKVTNSKDEEREEYLQIFRELKNSNLSAGREYLKKNNDIYVRFQADVKTDRQKFLKKTEVKEEKQDQNDAENIINSLNNL